VKYKYEELILTIIKTIIGAYIAGYVLAHIPFGLKKFILTALIILTTFFIIDYIYMMLKRYIKRNESS
jgi:uncharacterized membrane protein YeaQ/YmgE (transglycosylase-associated protein family)